MKVGILTYHNTTNYGATLQAYALQKKITDYKCECEIINYQCEAVVERYKIKKINEIKSFKQFIKHILTFNSKKKLKDKFEKFNNKNLNISSIIYNRSNISLSVDKYDIFIVGSDQVWNLNLSGEDYTYFLDFVEKNEKKYSYGASFGYKEIPNNYFENTYKLLKNFNYISVREKQGQEIIKNILETKVEVVLDPTLLLNKEEWTRISKYQSRKREYILLYIIALTPSIIEFTKKLAKEYNCDIVYINHSYKIEFGMINIRDAGPEEFLGYLRNAKYVVTSSFHGVVFSINFEKQFFFELSKAKGNFNSRLENIIDMLDLNEREIVNGSTNSVNNINYKRVNAILNNQRKQSIKFIQNILEEYNE